MWQLVWRHAGDFIWQSGVNQTFVCFSSVSSWRLNSHAHRGLFWPIFVSLLSCMQGTFKKVKSGVNQTFVCFSSVSSWRLIWMAPNSMGMLTGSCCDQFQVHCCLLCVMLGQCNFVNGNCHMSQNGWIITILYVHITNVMVKAPD